MSKIYVTQFDYDRLMKLLNKKTHDDYDRALIAELEKCEIIEPKNVPPDIITMNSQIQFKDEQGSTWKYWLVFPEDADLASQKISILSPIGCSLIGYRKGDTITIPMPKGEKKLIVEEIIHQPEREGKFDV